MKLIRLDGKDYEVGSDGHLAKIDDMAKASVSQVQAKLDAAEKARDDLQGRLDATEKKVAKDKDDFIAEKKKADEEAEKKDDTKKKGVRARLRKLVRSLVLREMGDDEDEEKVEKKLDSIIDAAYSDDGWKQHMVETIKEADPAFHADGLTDSYVEGAYDQLQKLAAKASAGGIDSVVKAARKAGEHLDMKDNPVIAARIKRDRDALNAWKSADASTEGSAK